MAPLQPQQFSAQQSPAEVRLILNDSTRVTARHPVLVGDSLVWADSVRRAIPVGNIRRAEVPRLDGWATALSLVFVAGAVVGLAAFVKRLGVDDCC